MANRGSSQGCANYHLHKELWKLCAGPLVDIPRVGEKVFYFPQGRLEQLEASTNQELNQTIHLFNLPSKILCSVLDIQLQAEQDSDEVYMQITLVPEQDQSEPTSPESYPPELPTPIVYSFYKDMNQEPPAKDLITKDLHGEKWPFKHVFRGQPFRHLLAKGWSTFVNEKRPVAGDTFVFLRGENGEMRVSLQRVARQQCSMPSSIISSQNMHLGVLATASQAMATQTLFVVLNKPRTGQFIIGLNKYLEAINNCFAIGMRFKMRFEGKNSAKRSSPVRRFTGTIVGVEDLSSQWKNSKWRSLKVQWDEAAPIASPDRVSPWEIEPFPTPCLVFGVDLKRLSNALLAEKAPVKPGRVFHSGIEEHRPITVSGADSSQISEHSTVNKEQMPGPIQVSRRRFKKKQSCCNPRSYQGI